MGWVNYYDLLKKYDGDLKKATSDEMIFAARCNPNNPSEALKLARKKFEKEKDSE